MAYSKMRSQPPTVPFSFRIGLWPIGSRRLVDDEEHSPCVDKRCAGPHVTDPPGSARECGSKSPYLRHANSERA
jgi:hypothetical protein